MESYRKKLKIMLSAEDDDDDRLLIKESFESLEIQSDAEKVTCHDSKV